jgi:hypothetical protein
MSDITAGLMTVDAATLTPMVRVALDLRDAEVTTWSREAFGHSLDAVYGTTRSIYRFTGVARAGGRDVPWTMVLKIVAAPATPDDPASPANGEREALAYRSGFLDHISGVRAPRCYGVSDRPAGGWWIWLEDVVDSIGREWPRERYLLAARHLGQFNAAQLSRDTASFPWLSRSPLREAFLEMAPGVARIAEARDNPFVAQAISPRDADTLIALLGETGAWLDRLDQLPQTVCHWDAHRANLMSHTSRDGTVETVAIDWAGVGWGPLGSEMSKFLSQTVNFYGMSAEALPALDLELFEEYMAGLRHVGWSGDERPVRFGHVAVSAVRMIVRTSTALELAFNERARQAFERAAGQSFVTLAGRFKATMPYYLALVDEAGRLADSV